VEQVGDMSLSAEHARLVEQLREVCQVDSDESAAALLRGHGWDLQATISAMSDDTNQDFRETDSMLEAERSERGSVRRRRRSFDNSSTASPSRDGLQSDRPEQQRVGGWNILGVFASILLFPLRVLTGFNGDVDTQEAADLFQNVVKKVERQQAVEHPEEEPQLVEFLALPYRGALAEAARSEKLLLVYLHSTLHPDADRFSNRLLQLLTGATEARSCVMCWGGGVEYTDAHQLSEILRVHTYPYVALLEPPSNPRKGKAKLLARVEGMDDLDTLVPKLTEATEHFSAVLAERVAQRYEATERQRLREEQDEALRQAMEEDSRREEERRRKQQEETEAKEEKEANERARLDAIETKRASLGPEPEAVKGETTTVRFQLPNGSQFKRRFHVNDTMQQLRNFVDVELHNRELAICNYAIAVNFPKISFGPDADHSKTLQENGLVPQVAVMVQDLDS